MSEKKSPLLRAYLMTPPPPEWGRDPPSGSKNKRFWPGENGWLARPPINPFQYPFRNQVDGGEAEGQEKRLLVGSCRWGAARLLVPLPRGVGRGRQRRAQRQRRNGNGNGSVTAGAPCIATRSVAPAISTVGGIPLRGVTPTERKISGGT